MVPFNSLLNSQPSRFAVWIKFYLCSGVNVWSGWDWFFPTSRIPAAGSGLFPPCSLHSVGALGAGLKLPQGNLIPARRGGGDTGEGRGTQLQPFQINLRSQGLCAVLQSRPQAPLAQRGKLLPGDGGAETGVKADVQTLQAYLPLLLLPVSPFSELRCLPTDRGPWRSCSPSAGPVRSWLRLRGAGATSHGHPTTWPVAPLDPSAPNRAAGPGEFGLRTLQRPAVWRLLILFQRSELCLVPRLGLAEPQQGDVEPRLRGSSGDWGCSEGAAGGPATANCE